MEELMEINGKPVTREVVKDWLRGKKVTLWSDWCVTDPDRLEIAVDWFLGEMGSLSQALPVPAGV